jgi:hypothetical protein
MAQEPTEADGDIQPIPSHAGTGQRAEVVRTGPSAVRTAIDTLRRAVPIIDGMARAIMMYAFVTLTAGAAIWLAILDGGTTGPGRPITLLVWAIVLAFPPATLVTVALALRLLARLPDRLVELPDRTREHMSSLGRLAGQARQVRGRGWLRSGWSVIRLWRTAAASRDLVEIAAPVAFLFSPMTLFVAFIAAVGGMVEILGGAIAIIWLLVSNG